MYLPLPLSLLPLSLPPRLIFQRALLNCNADFMTLHWNPEMGSHHTPCIFTKYFKGHITRHLSLWLNDLWLYLPLCILAMVECAPHNRPHRLASFVWSSLSPLSVPSLSGLVSYLTYISSWRLSTWHLVCIGLLLWAWFHFKMSPPLMQGLCLFHCCVLSAQMMPGLEQYISSKCINIFEGFSFSF